MADEHYDVLIIGAGLSGIGTACHLSRLCPDKRYAILERRASIGGTWDLFRYPGIRSDSDMFSFGYGFRPWNDLKVLADGPSIRQYIRETADEFGVSGRIRFGISITAANWSSQSGAWQLTATDAQSGQTRHYSCDVLISCTGYYNYESGYLPDFPGAERFTGRCVHPQHWPEDLDYRDKRIVVIGSGATAVTLIPAMADTARHVTMLQRSPSYIYSVPAMDRLSALLMKLLPQRWVYAFARRRNIAIQRWMYKAARRWPERTRKLLLGAVARQLDDPANLRHFTPTYNPWEQRLCAVPDGDLFRAINAGKASVETDTIASFTEKGILLHSGKELEADIIVTATGLEMELLGGIALTIDGQPLPLNRYMTYRATLLENVPNMAVVLGYTNASWTLKADIAARYLCRLLNHMQEHGKRVFMPVDHGGAAQAESIMASLTSGYVRRADAILPRQGKHGPWKVTNDYRKDAEMLLKDSLDDGVLQFDPVLQTGEVDTENRGKAASDQAA